MQVVDTLIAATWVAFWVLWIAAGLRAKAPRTRSGSYIGVRVVLLLLILLLARAGALGGHGGDTHDPWVVGIGLSLFVAGLAGAVWARAYLGRNWGTPMSEKADPELVTTGPYRYVRHPIYSGIILAMVGTALAISIHWLVPAVVVGAFFVYSATVEERIMARRFPDTYPAYRRATKMLIPFVF